MQRETTDLPFAHAPPRSPTTTYALPFTRASASRTARSAASRTARSASPRATRIHPLLEQRNPIRRPWLIRRHRPAGHRTINHLRVRRNTHPRRIIKSYPRRLHTFNVPLPETRADICRKAESHRASFAASDSTTLYPSPCSTQARPNSAQILPPSTPLAKSASYPQR